MCGARQDNPSSKIANRSADAPASAGVVRLQSHPQVALGNLRGVCVYCIDHYLYFSSVATLEGAREIRRNDNEKIQVQTLERLFCLFRAYVLSSHIEIHVLGKRIDEVTAFCCEAFVVIAFSP